MYLLLRRLDLPTPAALFGALAFTFSGSSMLRVVHINAVAVLAHIPWLLANIDILLRTTERRRLAAAQLSIALLTGSEFLMGHPQYVWFSLMVETAFLVWRYDRSTGLSRVLLIVFAKLTGGMMGAIQILPTLDTLSTSIRSHPTLQYRLIGSLHPVNLVQLVSPFLLKDRVYGINTTECGLYSGAFCTLAPIWLYLRRDSLKQWRPIILAGAIFGAIMLLLAFGKYGGFYYLVVNLPIFRDFRIPARYIHFVHFALAILAAIAYSDLVALRRDRQCIAWRSLWPLTIPLLLSVTVGAGSVLLSKIHPAIPGMENVSSPGHAAFGTLLITVGTALFLAAGRGLQGALPALTVFLCIDLGVWGLGYLWKVPDLTVPAFVDSLQVPPATALSGRIYLPRGVYSAPLAVTMKGISNSTGYLGLEPATRLDPEDPLAQQIAGVQWKYDTRHEPRWIRTASELPRVRLVTNTQVSANSAQAIHHIDVRATALVDAPVEPLNGAPGTAVIVEDRPGRIVVETAAEGSQLLVLSENYHPGWRAVQDGHDARIVRVNGDFQGCVVSAGHHRVTFRFQPASFHYGRLLSLIGACLAFGCFLYTKHSARRCVTSTAAGVTKDAPSSMLVNAPIKVI